MHSDADGVSPGCGESLSLVGRLAQAPSSAPAVLGDELDASGFYARRKSKRLLAIGVNLAASESVYHTMTALLTILRRGNDTDLEIERGKVICLTEVSRVGPLFRIEGIDAAGHPIVVVRHYTDLDTAALLPDLPRSSAVAP